MKKKRAHFTSGESRVLKEMVQKRGNYISTQDHAKIQFDSLFRNIS